MYLSAPRPTKLIEYVITTLLELEKHLEGSSSYIDAFRGTDLRRTHIACGTVTWQVLSGISFMNVYGTYFFKDSGITDAFLINVALQACQLAGIVVMFPSLHYLGRRTILLVGGLGQTVCMFLVAIVGTAAPGSEAASKTLVLFCCLYGFFFAWSWGPVGWIVTSEISSTALRSKTQSLAATSSWVFTLAINVALPYLINPSDADLGVKVGFIFGVLCALGLIWCFFVVPETKGRTLEELDELFLNRVPLRKFTSYKCSGHIQHHGKIDQVGLEKDEKKQSATIEDVALV